MISILRGEVASVTAQSAVILVGGVGFEVLAPAPTLSAFRPGAEALVYTSLVVREDSLTLYGFADAETRTAFEVITSITGVGPKLGLAVLSVHDPDSLREAVVTENRAALQSVPGIGPKSAARMLLELKGRLVHPAGVVAGQTSLGSAGAAPARPQVIEALQSLGWTERDAETAWTTFAAQQPELASSGSVPQILKAVLATLSRGR